MASWKSMDTAPKDGTSILLHIGGYITEPVAIEGWWDKDGGYWSEELQSMKGEWQVVRLDSHGCGCCGSSNNEPVGWIELPS